MMLCPKCTCKYTIITDSRCHSGKGRNNFIRRRRRCDECGFRFTTYERIYMEEVEPKFKPLHEILEVKFEREGLGQRADAKALPGTPPVGKGITEAEALYDALPNFLRRTNTRKVSETRPSGSGAMTKSNKTDYCCLCYYCCHKARYSVGGTEVCGRHLTTGIEMYRQLTGRNRVPIIIRPKKVKINEAGR